MPDEPSGPVDEGITTTPQVEAPAPAHPENAAEPSGGGADEFAMWRNPDGTIDGEKAAKGHREVQTKFGKQSVEVGDLRKEVADYQAVFQAEYVVDPDNAEKWVHKSALEQRQSQPEQPPPSGQLTKDEINEKLRDMMVDEPDEFLKLAARLAGNERRTEDAVFANPEAQKIVSDYPDVRPRAEELVRQGKIPLDVAFKQALGEKMLAAAGGGDATQPTPTVNLDKLNNAARTFMGPKGTTPEPEAKTELTPDQIARAKRHGIDPKELEAFSDPAWRKR